MVAVYIVLVVCVSAVLGVALALYLRVRGQVRRSDSRLKRELEEIERERQGAEKTR